MKLEKRVFSILLTVLFALSIAACGGGGGGGDVTPGEDDDTVTATSAQTQSVTEDLMELTGAAVAGVFGALTLEGEDDTIIAAMKRAITISTATSCSEGNGTSCSSSSADFTGTESGSVSGSCSVNVCYSGESSGSFDAVGTCTNYIDTTGITINGDMDVEGSWSDDGYSGSVDVETQDGTVTLPGGTCSLVINVEGSWTSSTVTVSGCAGLCGEYFAVSGTETW